MIRLRARHYLLLTGVILIPVVLVALLHTPGARRWVLAKAIARVAPDGSVRVGRIDYNLFTLRFVLHDVALLGPDHPQPWFTAQTIIADLPWSALTGDDLSVQEVDLIRPALQVRVESDGRSNFAGGGTRIDAPLTFGRLALRDLSAEWVDVGRSLQLTTRGLSLDLEDSTLGAVRLAQPVRIARGDTSIDLSLEQGNLAWNGTGLRLDGFAVGSSVADFTLDGTVDQLLADRNIGLRAGARVHLDGLGALLPDTELPNGQIDVRASVDGPAAAPRVELTMESAGLRRDSLSLEDLSAAMSYADGRLTIESASARVFAGHVRGSGVISMESSSQLQLGWSGVALAEIAAQFQPGPAPIDGTTAGEMQVTWNGLMPADVNSIDAGGELRFEARTRPADGEPVPISGSAEIELRSAAWRLRTEVASRGDFAISADLRGEIADPVSNSTLGGDVSVEIVSLARAAALGAAWDVRLADERLQPEGQVQIQAMLGGALSAPSASGRISGLTVSLYGVEPGSVATTFEASPTAFVLPRAELSFAGATVSGDLRLDLESTRLAARFEFAAPDLSRTLIGLGRNDDIGGSLSGALVLEGPALSPRAGGSLRIGDLKIRDLPLLQGEAKFSALDSGTRLDEFTLVDAAGNRIEATGEADVERLTGGLDVRAAIGAPAAYETVVPGAATIDSLGGNLTMAIDMAADVPAFAVDLRELEVALPRLPLRLEAPTRITWNGDGFAVEPLALTIGAARATIEGALGNVPTEGLTARVNGPLDQLSDLVQLVAATTLEGSAAPVRTGGAIEFVAHVGGTLDAPEPTGTLRVVDGRLQYADLPAIEAVSVEAAIDARGIHATRMEARWQGASAVAGAMVPLSWFLDRGMPESSSEARFQARVADLTPALAAPWLTPERLELLQGSADVAVELMATAPAIEAVRASFEVSSLALEANGVAVRQRVPTRLRLADGTLRVESWEWTRGGGREDEMRFTVSGTADLIRRQLGLGFAGDLQLAWLTPWLELGAVEGALRLEGTVGGSFTAPEPSGTIEVLNAGLRLPDPPLLVTGLNGRLQITPDGVESTPIAGRANGGDVALFVTAERTDAGFDTRLGITGRRVALQSSGVRAETDVDLTLSVPPDRQPLMFGRISLLGGGYRSRQALTRDLVDTMNAGVSSETEAATDVRFDVRIDSTRSLVVDTNYAQLQVDLDLRLRGSMNSPGVSGRVALQPGGTIDLAANRYTIERGALDFIDPSRIAPTLDLLARARVGRHDLTVMLTGDAFSPRLTAGSDDGALSESDALSLMATGRTLAETGGAGRQILQEQAYGMLTGRLQGVARSTGFDSIRFERNTPSLEAVAEADLFPRNTDLAARLTLTRSLQERSQLLYSQSLTNPADQTWIGTVDLPFSLTLRAGTFDDGSNSAELRHVLRFGGRGTTERAAPAAQRVRNVAFTGDLLLAPERLRDRLQVGEGDRFDFLAWQQDRDRLLQLYRDHGHLEARIVAQRTAVGDVPVDGTATAIDLDYTVTPGAATTLEIRGFEPGKATRQAMLSAWQQSLVDDFLVTDLEELARDRLARDGYLAPHVSVTVEAPLATNDAARKHILIDIAPGQRYRGRELRFAGNSLFTANELTALLRAGGHENSIWWEPRAGAAAIRAAYRGRGRLDAEVTIDGAEFGPAGATLPIRIDEGTPITIGRIVTEGARQMAEAELLPVLESHAGEPYSADHAAAAENAVAAIYRRAGFNLVEVRARLDAQGNPPTLTVTVNEGVRQTLGEIVIDGDPRTRHGIIRRAIGIEPGSALDLAEVERGRQRLYQTGLFENVAIDLQALAATPDGQPVRLRVTLTERATIELKYGLQVQNEEADTGNGRVTRTGLSATLRHNGFLNTAGSLSLAGRYRPDERFVRAGITFPTLFGSSIRSSAFASQYRQERGEAGQAAIRLDLSEFTFEQRVSLSRRLSVGYALAFERNHTIFLDLPPDHFLQTPAFWANRVVPSLVYDSRDDPLRPARGLFHSSTFEWAGDLLGSELPFQRYNLKQFAFFPAGPVISATAVRLGTGKSRDPVEPTLDTSRLFRAGGGLTVRGYPEDSLGGRAFFGQFIPGGNAALILNQEVRFPVWKWVRGVAFVDAGKAYASASEIRLSTLAFSAGAGIRVVTPWLMLRLDYGVPLSVVDNLGRRPPGKFHFGIGHIF